MYFKKNNSIISLGESFEDQMLELGYEVVSEEDYLKEKEAQEAADEQGIEKEKQEMVKKLASVKNMREFRGLAEDLVEFIIKY